MFPAARRRRLAGGEALPQATNFLYYNELRNSFCLKHDLIHKMDLKYLLKYNVQLQAVAWPLLENRHLAAGAALLEMPPRSPCYSSNRKVSRVNRT